MQFKRMSHLDTAYFRHSSLNMITRKRSRDTQETVFISLQSVLYLSRHFLNRLYYLSRNSSKVLPSCCSASPGYFLNKLPAISASHPFPHHTTERQKIKREWTTGKYRQKAKIKKKAKCKVQIRMLKKRWLLAAFPCDPAA